MTTYMRLTNRDGHTTGYRLTIGRLTLALNLDDTQDHGWCAYVSLRDAWVVLAVWCRSDRARGLFRRRAMPTSSVSSVLLGRLGLDYVRLSATVVPVNVREG